MEKLVYFFLKIMFNLLQQKSSVHMGDKILLHMGGKCQCQLQ